MSSLNTHQNRKLSGGERIQGEYFTWEIFSFPLESVTVFPLTKATQPSQHKKEKYKNKKNKQKHPKSAETSLHNFKNMRDKFRRLSDIYMCYTLLISDEE